MVASPAHQPERWLTDPNLDPSPEAGNRIIAAVLIALRLVSPRWSAVGRAMAIVLFLGTLSFLFTTPGVTAAGGFPVLSLLPGQFLIKDPGPAGRLAVDTRRLTRSRKVPPQVGRAATTRLRAIVHRPGSRPA